MVITVEIIAWVARMPVSFSSFSSSHSTPMPTAAPATPMPTRAANAADPASQWCAWPDCSSLKTTTAMMAPMGSMVVPSCPRIVVSFLPGRAPDP